MRTPFVVLGLMVLGSSMAAAVEDHAKPKTNVVGIERLMALAETDLQFRRAELGLIGAALPTLPEATVAPARAATRVVSSTAAPRPAATASAVRPPSAQR